jgi:starch phosphorylase
MPEGFKTIVDLAYNIRWSWHPLTRKMFKRLDPPLWFSTRHNVVKILRDISKKRLEKMVNDPIFMKHYEKVIKEFKSSLHKDNKQLWFPSTYPDHADKIIAYLSMEYGLHASVPIYSGGLGILSGDHLKESSDLGIPLIAVGFLYQEGYFKQVLPLHGWQEEIYREADFNDLPITEVMDPEKPNEPLLIPIKFNDVDVWIKIWLLNVGRVKLYLMDSNIDQNSPWDADLTDRLYGGAKELRLKQEMILGFGAVQLFEKLGIQPDVWHLNEGHCAFSSIERIIKLMNNKNLSFEEALNEIRQNTVFTTHTPVPAGHDVFPFHLVESYFMNPIGMIGRENFFSLGTFDFEKEGGSSGFNMTALGMRTSKRFNGVSKLHWNVSEKMFLRLWDELKNKYKDFEPLTYITNGIHVPSFVSPHFKDMFEMTDEEWEKKHDDPNFWKLDQPMMETITDNMIWEYHKVAKLRLMSYIRETARQKIKSGEWDCTHSIVNGALLDPDVLTFGFARRFATYKRATLIFTDFNRLSHLLNDEYRPIQIIFAGKAHPADDPGKRLIQEVIHNAKMKEIGHRVAFIENYDLVSAKLLFQGVDVWLNTPLRPNEASGTSGMKAACNFVPNLSVLDGWWAEGYNFRNGWAINPTNKEFADNTTQNWFDANTLYEILENEIIPAYYDCDSSGIPIKWVAYMRHALISAIPIFTARRMLKEYAQNLYIKSM